MTAPANPVKSGQRPTSAFRVANPPPKTRVLVVDDEEMVRVALARFLTARGIEAVAEASGAAALARLGDEAFDVMLCDIRMPEMTGIELLPHALKLDPDLAILMLTAVNDASTATEALSEGAMDYLVKPIGLAELERAVERAVHRRQLEVQRRRAEWHVREEVAIRTEQLEQEKRALHALTVGVADSLINAMEAKDAFLRGHSQRVADLAASVAEAMGMHADVVENVRMAGRLHDVGKIGIRESILNKPGSLTEEEFAHVKEHVVIGMEILAPLKHLPVVLEYVHHHHEHFDGGGYPQGLTGENISIGGRILAACDAFDALTSQRAYRDAYLPRETIDRLRECIGQLLDPAVFAALARVVLARQTLTFLDERSSAS